MNYIKWTILNVVRQRVKSDATIKMAMFTVQHRESAVFVGEESQELDIAIDY